MKDLASLIEWDKDYDFLFVADTPACIHCHHYNLFIDKTVDDALGASKGVELRTEAAQEFYYTLLDNACRRLNLEEPSECFEFASELFAAWGHGQLDLTELNADGGVAYGDNLHYSYSWLEKYGDTEKRYYPADAVATGFSAAALAVAYDREPHNVVARETNCLVLGDDRCKFELKISEGEPYPEPVDKDATLKVMPETFGGINEDQIQELTGGLREFLSGVSGDERGLIEAFGIFITINPTSLYNRLSYEMLARLRNRHGSFAQVSAGLLREAGRLCGFNTFGGIISSPEWEALTGTNERDMLTIATHSCVIARGLGFGRWQIADFEPERLVTFQAPSTYEGPYYQLRHSTGSNPACYLFEGACEAVAQLGHGVDWSSQPDFTPAFYEEIFRSEDNSWTAEQIRCVSCGDDICEVRVTRQ